MRTVRITVESLKFLAANFLSMHRFSVSVMMIALSKFVFVGDVNSWSGWGGGVPTNTTKIKILQILVIPYAVSVFSMMPVPRSWRVQLHLYL